MGHHFGRFLRLEDGSPHAERLRQFVRRNRKMILIFLGMVAVVGLAILTLIIYFTFQLLDKAPQIISGSSEAISQNQGVISQVIQWGISTFRQLGFLLNG